MSAKKFFTYRVTPTVYVGDADTGDVVFNLTKVLTGVRGGESVKLKSITGIDTDKTDKDLGFIFFQKNTTANIGTLGATSNISDANFLANVPIGCALFRWGTAGVLANVNISTYPSASVAGGAELILTSSPDAAEGEIYVAAITTQDDCNYAAADDLELIFHFETM